MSSFSDTSLPLQLCPLPRSSQLDRSLGPDVVPIQEVSVQDDTEIISVVVLAVASGEDELCAGAV